MFLKCARMIPGKPGIRGFPGGSVVKNPPANVGDTRVVGLIPVEKIPCSGKWLPTPVSLPGKFHGQRNLAGYGPWSHIESIGQSDWAHTHTHTHECRVSANNPLQRTPSTLDQNCLLLYQFSRSVESNSLRPHGLQRVRLPCPSPTPRACSNSCLSSRWCHPTISFSVVLLYDTGL